MLAANLVDHARSYGHSKTLPNKPPCGDRSEGEGDGGEWGGGCGGGWGWGGGVGWGGGGVVVVPREDFLQAFQI